MTTAIALPPQGRFLMDTRRRVEDTTSPESPTNFSEELSRVSTAQSDDGAEVPESTPQPSQAAAEAYWQSQPAEVQELRSMDIGDRYSKAVELAHKGFKVDVPIQVWGWDPVQTMQNRANMGYTWVPSAAGESVQVAPGLTFPGLKAYDPNSPPADAIPVNLDFLKSLKTTT